MVTKYIIDSNVFIQHPHILSNVGNHEIIIPQSVVDDLEELSNRGHVQGLSDLVYKAMTVGAKILHTPPKTDRESYQGDGDPLTKKLTKSDFDLFRIAKMFVENEGKKVPCVVTSDKILGRFLISKGIRSITAKEFVESHVNDQKDERVIESANAVISSQNKYVNNSFILGVLSSLLVGILYSNFTDIVSTITVWGTIVFIPILGGLLYWYREKYRLSYGIFECCFSLTITTYVFVPNFNYELLDVTHGIQIVGGLYVMVRGLDNIGKGIAGTRVEKYWKKVF